MKKKSRIVLGSTTNVSSTPYSKIFNGIDKYKGKPLVGMTTTYGNTHKYIHVKRLPRKKLKK